MAKDKEFNIKINGLKEGVKDTENLKKGLDDATKSMDNQNKTVGDYSKAIREASKEIKNIQGQMLGLEKGSKAWTELAKKAGDYKDQIDDIREATRRYASDTKQLDDVINLAQSATAAFTLYKGAMSAFGVETENAEKAMQKLMAAMSIIQSLQALQNTLKGSSATAALLNGTMKALTLGIEGTTVATKALRIALMSIGIGLVIALVTTLITHWEDLVGWFEKTFPFLNNLQQKFVGLGKAIVNWVTNPIVTLGKVLQKVFSGDFSGALEEAKKGIINQFKGTLDAYSKGYQEAMTKKTIEEENKRTEYAYKMLQAKAGADAKYSKEGIALQKKIFDQRRTLAKGNKDKLDELALDEANFYRECQEHKAAAAKKSAQEREAAEKKASAEAKRLAQEEERKRKEAERAAEEQRKKEYEAAKELSSAKAKGADLEIDGIKATINEKKRLAEVDLDTNNKEIKNIQDRIKELQKIAENENLSKKTRLQAVEQIKVEEDKLKRVDAERIKNLKRIGELEEDIVRLNKERSENAVMEDLKNQLSAMTMTKEEFYSLIDGTSNKLTSYTETQLQYVKNAAQQMKNISQEAATAIAKIKNTTTNNSTPTSSGSGGSTKIDKRKSPSDGKEFWESYLSEMQNTIFEGMDTISMFMDFAIEETQRALEEVENLHEKALEKVDDSANKIKELNEKLKDSANMNKEATKEQLADEQLLYAERLAEEQRLADEEKKLKNKAAQQEAKARRMELGTQMAMGIANTAQGVTKVLSSFLPPYSTVLAAMIGALGAVQVGLIAAQMSKVKAVKYAEGGILSGPSHAQGGIPVGRTGIEVEGGEMVVNKKDTARYADVLHKINNNDPSVRYLQGSRGSYADTKIRKFAQGGTLNFESVDANLRANNSMERIMGAISDIDMQPIVSVVDIAKVEDRLVRVRGLAGR